MPYKHKRDCPVCHKPGLRCMSNHLRQVHHLYGDERKKWLGRTRFSISHKHCSDSLPGRPTHTVEEIKCVRKKTCSVRQPTKAARKVTAYMLTKPVRNSTFPISSHFWLWVHTKWENVFCPTNFETQSYRV